ncbi:MAG TPA: hypothetical protein VF510_04295 [Ktedonobacterales bacterium]
MRKPTIITIWLIGLAVFVVGLIVCGVSLGLLFANGGTYVPAASGNGYDFIPRTDSYFWTTLGFAIAGCAIALGGGVAQLVAWVGAVINTYSLRDKTWFYVLLIGGLIGLAFGLVGFAVMLAYVIAGPDGMATIEPQQPMREPPTRQTTPLAPTG